MDRLRAAGCVFAEDEAQLLLLEAGDVEQLERQVARRVGGEPLEQIVGWAEFGGRRYAVAPGVFVPRRRTELLARAAVEGCRPGSVLVDLCCGVGAVAGYVVDRVPDLEAYGTELDPVAADCARRNLGPRVKINCGDLYRPLPAELRGHVDVIAANAPYVPTSEIIFMPTEARDHEAPATLDGGEDGLELHRRIIDQAPLWLAAGGRLLIETGREQAQVDLDLLRAAGFTATMITDDEIDGTVVIGETP
ncbi:putative protein N(5)-glutamine methyltransferase [Microlunatus elymi]|uniref:Methyltransferase domain-containing protein n=1 Tax=Microlunatus elymi TaxID=2596828 RepID=A0A516Q5Y7_9ACTN|nr:putative protein N(5)-glutamine methyltransferase [Microlunatus elymi]